MAAKKGGGFVAEPRGGMTTVLGQFTKGPKGRQAYGAAKGRNIQAAMKAHGAKGKASRKKAGAGAGGGGG